MYSAVGAACKNSIGESWKKFKWTVVAVKDETTLESLKESLLKLDETSLHEVSQVVNSFLVVQKVKSGLEKVV